MRQARTRHPAHQVVLGDREVGFELGDLGDEPLLGVGLWSILEDLLELRLEVCLAAAESWHPESVSVTQAQDPASQTYHQPRAPQTDAQIRRESSFHQ